MAGTAKKSPASGRSVRSASSTGRDGGSSSGRKTFCTGNGWAIGSTPSVFNFLQLIDIADDCGELPGHDGQIVVGQVEPGEPGDFADFVDVHEILSYQRSAISRQFQRRDPSLTANS